MKKAIIGAGGFAREVRAQMEEVNVPMFVDDVFYTTNSDNIKPMSELDIEKYQVIVAVGSPHDRAAIVSRLPLETNFFTFVHSSAIILGYDVEVGEGSIICAGVIITTNITIGKHSQLNLHTSIGHDCRIGDYFTTAPGVRISGNNEIGSKVYFGTNSCTKEKLHIIDNSTIGLQAGIVKSIEISGTYIGTPAKLLRR